MNGGVVADPEGELTCHSLKIWAYDPAALRDPEFWLD